MGRLSGILSAQMVRWSIPILPILDVVPSPAPGCLAPGLPTGTTFAREPSPPPARAGWPRATPRGSLYADCTRRRARGQRQACTYGVDWILAPVWGNELGGWAGLLLACAGGGDTSRLSTGWWQC